MVEAELLLVKEEVVLGCLSSWEQVLEQYVCSYLSCFARGFDSSLLEIHTKP